MRDVTRIDPFCEELTALWKKCPDMRFGQLVVNALGVNPLYIIDNDAREKIRAFVLSQEEISSFISTDKPNCSIEDEKR